MKICRVVALHVGYVYGFDRHNVCCINGCIHLDAAICLYAERLLVIHSHDQDTLWARSLDRMHAVRNVGYLSQYVVSPPD